MIRPGEQAFFDIIHSFNGYRTCYYRTFSVGRSTQAQRDAYARAGEWMRLRHRRDQARRVAPTRWPGSGRRAGVRLPDEKAAFGLQFGHGLGLGLHERPIISRLSSLDAPMEIQKGMVFAVETYCPATDGFRRPARGGGGGGGGRRPDHHQVPLGRNCSSPTRTDLRGAMDEATALGLYRAMTRIRQFEKRAHDLFLQNLVKGTTHLGPARRRSRPAWRRRCGPTTTRS